MRILVDADGCPVKDIIIKVAKKYDVKVIMIKNIFHEIKDDYPEIITVDQGKDVADLALINLTKPDDIVITQDYGVAAMALGKKAYALHHNGWAYTEQNIEELLMKRHMGQELRRKHNKHSSKIPKRGKKEDEAFEKILRELMYINFK